MRYACCATARPSRRSRSVRSRSGSARRLRPSACLTLSCCGRYPCQRRTTSSSSSPCASGSLRALQSPFEALRDRQHTLTGLAAIADQPYLPVTFDDARLPDVRGTLVSSDYFPVLGISPSLGRLLGPTDDQDDEEEAQPRLSPTGRSRSTAANTADVPAATSATIHTTRTGTRVRDGISASTAITTSASPSHQGAPRSPGRRPANSSSKPRFGSGSRPVSISRLRAERWTIAGQPPRREQHRHGRQHRDRRTPDGAVSDGRRGDHEADADDRRDQRRGEEPGHRGEGGDQAEQQTRAPGRPPPAVGLGVGEAQGRVPQPRQGGRHDDDPQRRDTNVGARDRAWLHDSLVVI